MSQDNSSIDFLLSRSGHCLVDIGDQFLLRDEQQNRSLLMSKRKEQSWF